MSDISRTDGMHVRFDASAGILTHTLNARTNATAMGITEIWPPKCVFEVDDESGDRQDVGRRTGRCV
ncbi:MAG: hypothetical protein HPY73_02575 [Methanomassiliicoccales archaeon]|nr:MAG: hypothetical protein HPY73_02575 [Methanomassiliicoccales archaeon]